MNTFLLAVAIGLIVLLAFYGYLWWATSKIKLPDPIIHVEEDPSPVVVKKQRKPRKDKGTKKPAYDPMKVNGSGMVSHDGE